MMFFVCRKHMDSAPQTGNVDQQRRKDHDRSTTRVGISMNFAPSSFWKSTIFSKMPRRLKNHATKQAQTTQKTAKKANSNHLNNYWCFAFSRNYFAFFHYIYIYMCCIFPQFLLMSISAAFPIALHFVPSFCKLRRVFFFLGAKHEKDHRKDNRGAQSQAMVPSPHIRSSIGP